MTDIQFKILSDAALRRHRRSASEEKKITIEEAFPNGLTYVAPNPKLFLSTSGVHWDYQPDPTLYHILQDELKDYYRHFKNREIDKTYMPVFFFLAGAGTGKSRNALEFSQSAAACLDESELKQRIKTAWVFHVTLENGTSWRMSKEPDALEAIGTRMVAQLLREDHDNIINKYKAPHPKDVVKLLAKGVGVNVDINEEWKKKSTEHTVILVVDGMQNFIHDGIKTDLDQCLTAIGGLNSFGPFWVSCCTATITEPIQQSLNNTHRKRVYLPVASLKTPTVGKQDVFPMNDLLMELMVSDCGGHGRALETLYDTIKNEIMKERERDYWQSKANGHEISIRNSIVKSDIEDYIQNCNLNYLMDKVLKGLKDNYNEVLTSTGPRTAQAIARAVISHTMLTANELIPGSTKTPDQVQQLGLVRFICSPNSSTGYLNVPYIWIWIFAGQTFTTWMFDDYESIKPLFHKVDNSSQRILHWRDYEFFLASIRCLKSQAIKHGAKTTIGEVHLGADLSEEDKNIPFINRSLTLVSSKEQISTHSTKENSTEWLVKCSHGSINARKGDHCVINGSSTKAGDHFLSLGAFAEVSQSKDLSDSTAFSQLDFYNERIKAASEDDFFILYITKGNCNIEPLPRSAIVHRDNWDTYFGPFAGRAYLYAKQRNLDISTATVSQLQLAGISSDKAKSLKRKVSDIMSDDMFVEFDGESLRKVFDELEIDEVSSRLLSVNNVKRARVCFNEDE